MKYGYQTPLGAKIYLEFLASQDGLIQQNVLYKAVADRLPQDRNLKILDAACGTGWLAGRLAESFGQVSGCDSSQELLSSAKTIWPRLEFQTADLEQPLPYPSDCFDFVILNMAAPDMKNLSAAFANLSCITKPGGRLIVTAPNPELTYPAAVWKRSWLDILLFRKPKLIKKMPPKSGSLIQREFIPKSLRLDSYYYSLDDYMKAANNAGFSRKLTQQLRSESDSPDFDLAYRLYRHPLLLLLEFEKSVQ